MRTNAMIASNCEIPYIVRNFVFHCACAITEAAADDAAGGDQENAAEEAEALREGEEAEAEAEEVLFIRI